MNKTSITWTETTWNPITGCTQCSPECRLCYAKAMALRLKGTLSYKYRNGFKLTLHPDELTEPLEYKKSNTMCFVCSMSDLFHEDVPVDYIDEVFKVIVSRRDITFQVLTKRSNRMYQYFQKRAVPQNCWIGVTCGCSESLHRLDDLRKIESASVRWVSVEPLLEDIGPKMDLTGINWVVVGGESGPGAHQMKEEWAWNLKELCDASGVAFFFKQWGSIGIDGVFRKKEKNGCLLKGTEYKEYPN